MLVANSSGCDVTFLKVQWGGLGVTLFWVIIELGGHRIKGNFLIVFYFFWNPYIGGTPLSTKNVRR